MSRLRTRGRGDEHVSDAPGVFVNVYEHTTTPLVAQSYDWTIYEVFTDVVADPADVYRVHPCTHLKFRASHPTFPRLTNYLGNYADFVGLRSGTDVRDLTSLFPGPSESDKARLAEEAYNAFFLQMPQEVSIPNFLWELRELKDMIPKIEESLSKTVAGGYLTYEFGYLPFVSDVTKLRNLTKTVASRLAYLRSTFGRETRVSYQGTWSVPDRSFEIPGASTRSGSPHRYTIPAITGTFRSGGYLYHRLNELYGVESTLRGLAGALGLNNPVGVLWEATPYSFVADWFTRSKEVVNHLAVQPFTGEWEVRRLTHSFSWEGVWYTDLHYLDSGTSPYFRIEEGTYKNYTRGLGLPVSSSVLTQEGLNPRQQMLAAALAVAR